VGADPTGEPRHGGPDAECCEAARPGLAPVVREDLPFHLRPLPADAGGGVQQAQAGDAVGMPGQVQLGQQATPGVAQHVQLVDSEVGAHRVDVGDIVLHAVVARAGGAADAPLIEGHRPNPRRQDRGHRCQVVRTSGTAMQEQDDRPPSAGVAHGEARARTGDTDFACGAAVRVDAVGVGHRLPLV